jgi:hypothetical protein
VAEVTSIQLRVRIDEFFKRSESGAIWGRVYFEIGDGSFFPDPGWTDLVAAFLRTWLGGLLQIAGETTTKERVPFYDGPFAVDVSLSSLGLLELGFVRKGTVRYSAEARIENLLQDAVSAAGQLLTNCQQKGWTNADTEALALLMEQGARTLADQRRSLSGPPS